MNVANFVLIQVRQAVVLLSIICSYLFFQSNSIALVVSFSFLFFVVTSLSGLPVLAVLSLVIFQDEKIIFAIDSFLSSLSISLSSFEFILAMTAGWLLSKIPTKKSRVISKVIHDRVVNGSILGIDLQTNKNILLTDEDANHHTLAVGTTGVGKTTAVLNIIEHAILDNIGLVYVDGKGDMQLAKRIEDYAKQHSRKFYLFSMQGDSLPYNPLVTGGFTSKKDRIIELRNWSEEYYKKIAENYLQVVIQIMDSLNIELDLLKLAKHLDLDELFILARNAKRQDILDRLSAIEKYRKDLQGLIVEIDNLANSEIGHLFNGDSPNVIDLQQAYQENAIVYFCLSPLAFPSYAKLVGRLIINDLKSVVASKVNDPKIFYTIFDEFSVFAGDQVINLINQGRGAGVCAVLATQSLADIAIRGGPYLLGQVINNCNNFIIQRQNNPMDANMLSDIIGSSKKLKTTFMIKKDSATSGTISEVLEHLITPDQIKKLKKGQALVVNKANGQFYRVQLRQGKI